MAPFRPVQSFAGACGLIRGLRVSRPDLGIKSPQTKAKSPGRPDGSVERSNLTAGIIITDIRSHPRGAGRPSLVGNFRPKGVGSAGCPMHPQPRARTGSKNAHEYSQRVHRISPAFPHAMVYGL